mmetsp:Transcript_80136/g.214605  ORF Transcript_80136/g.214605 Transcript_80136/m.214605 type:complete len:202 (-) Transcript_80136:1301-1906(-)
MENQGGITTDDVSRSNKKRRQGSRQGSHGNQDPRKARTAQAQKWSGTCEGGQAGSLVQFLQDMYAEGVIKLALDESGIAPHGVSKFEVLDLVAFRKRRTMWFQREGIEQVPATTCEGEDAEGDGASCRAESLYSKAPNIKVGASRQNPGREDAPQDETEQRTYHRDAVPSILSKEALAIERDKESSVNQAFRRFVAKMLLN